MAELNYISLKNEIPLLATIELTYRCCYYCRHCYIPRYYRQSKKKELNLLQIAQIFRELKNLGTMFLTLTGGEVFMRQDLIEICKLAKKYNFDVRLFTSLYLADENKLKEIKNIGVKILEVSLYGDRKIYESITQVKDSFNRVIDNLFIARRLGFKIKIKTPLMNINSKKVFWLYNFCKKNNFIFVLDPILTPYNDGNMSNLKFKVYLSDLKKIFSYKWFDYQKNENCMINRDFPLCGAGRNVISISPYGDVYPCLQLPVKVGNIKNVTIDNIWQSPKIKKIRKRLEIYPEICKNCKVIDFCSRCPGISYIYKRNFNYLYKDACFIANLIVKRY